MATSEEWRRAAIQRLEEAIRSCPGGPPPQLQNISEVENQLFTNAKTKEEYESTIQKALVYIMNHKKQQQANRMNQQLPGGVGGMAPGGVGGMTSGGVGGMAPGNNNRPQYSPFQPTNPQAQPQPQTHYGMGVQARPIMSNMPVQHMGQMMVPQQGPNQMMAPQQGPNQMMAPQQGPNQMMAPQQVTNPMMAPQQVSNQMMVPQPMPNQMMVPQQGSSAFGMQMHPQLQPSGMGGAMGGSMGGAMGGAQQYPGGGMMRYPAMQPGMMQQMAGVVRPVMGQRLMQPFQPRPTAPLPYEDVQSVTTIPNPSFSRPPGSAIPPYLAGTVQNHQGKPGAPSPYSTVSMSPGPPIAQGSPSGLVSHTHLPTAQSGVTSPAPATPILPPSPAMAGNSPAHQPSMTPEENEAYLRKFQELQTYVPLLDRMLSKLTKQPSDDRRNDQCTKLKSLYGLLQDNSKRVPLQTLHKCEQALKKMFEQHSDISGGQLSASVVPVAPGPPLPSVPLPQQTKAQSLLELKMVSSPPPTFASLADTIQLNPFPVERLPPSKRQGSKGKGTLSPGLKREIAALEAFNFEVVSSNDAAEAQDVILQCSLADTCLPAVPPLKVRIPFKYPKASVEWTNLEEYDKTPFCKLIGTLVVDKVSKLPSTASLSSLLTTWEACVLKAISCGLAA